MSLSDRLQRARTEQLMEAGVLPHDHMAVAETDTVEAVEAEPEIDDEPQGLFAPITIEARPVGLHLVTRASVDLTDAPDRDDVATCPTCNAEGKVDMVDLVGHTVHFTCDSCSTMWQVRKPAVSE